jgi:hypothetical protein
MRTSAVACWACCRTAVSSASRAFTASGSVIILTRASSPSALSSVPDVLDAEITLTRHPGLTARTFDSVGRRHSSLLDAIGASPPLGEPPKTVSAVLICGNLHKTCLCVKGPGGNARARNLDFPWFHLRAAQTAPHPALSRTLQGFIKLVVDLDNGNPG